MIVVFIYFFVIVTGTKKVLEKSPIVHLVSFVKISTGLMVKCYNNCILAFIQLNWSKCCNRRIIWYLFGLYRIFHEELSELKYTLMILVFNAFWLEYQPSYRMHNYLVNTQTIFNLKSTKKETAIEHVFACITKKQAISAVGKLILLARRHSTAHRSGDIQIQVPTYTST